MSEIHTLWNTLISQQLSLYLSLLCITLQTWNLSCFCQLSCHTSTGFSDIHGHHFLWWYTWAPLPSRCIWKSNRKTAAFLLALYLPEFLVLWIWHKMAIHCGGEVSTVFWLLKPSLCSTVTVLLLPGDHGQTAAFLKENWQALARSLEKYSQ